MTRQTAQEHEVAEIAALERDVLRLAPPMQVGLLGEQFAVAAAAAAAADSAAGDDAAGDDAKRMAKFFWQLPISEKSKQVRRPLSLSLSLSL